MVAAVAVVSVVVAVVAVEEAVNSNGSSNGSSGSSNGSSGSSNGSTNSSSGSDCISFFLFVFFSACEHISRSLSISNGTKKLSFTISCSYCFFPIIGCWETRRGMELGERHHSFWNWFVRVGLRVLVAWLFEWNGKTYFIKMPSSRI